MSEIVNKPGSNTFQEILNAEVHMPGVRVNRAEFLRTTLSKYFLEDVVSRAIEFNPAEAGISINDLSRITKSCISYETNKVTTISTVAGIPGGYAILASVPADLTQYFAHVIRVLQKLVYLYGWRDIFNEDDGIDDETLSLLTLFIGIMFGVQAANKIINKLAIVAAIRANNVIAAKPLTKGVIYPIVKKIALAITGKMNKRIFASGVSKTIPLIGAITSGGLTFITFKPMAYRLKKHLETLPIADINFYKEETNLSNEDVEIDINDFEDSDFKIDDYEIDDIEFTDGKQNKY